MDLISDIKKIISWYNLLQKEGLLTKKEEEKSSELPPNAIGHVTLALQQPLVTLPFAQSRTLGSLVLVDTATHKTSAAVLVR